MAGDEGDVVAERPQAVADRLEELVVIAAREIRSADRAPEQHVTHEGDLRRLVHEHDMARRMAGAVHHVEGRVAEAHRLAVGQPAVGHERLVDGEIILGARLRQPLDQEQVVLVRPLDLDAIVLGHGTGGRGVVDMAVGQQDLGDLDALLVDRLLEHVEVAARIDGGALHGFVAPHDGAVLLERGDGGDHDLEHASDLMPPVGGWKGVCCNSLRYRWQ